MEQEYQEHISIIKSQMDGQEMCEVSMYGGVDSLSSLVFSAMISNPRFAEVIINAAVNYHNINTSPVAHLN